MHSAIATLWIFSNLWFAIADKLLDYHIDPEDSRVIDLVIAKSAFRQPFLLNPILLGQASSKSIDSRILSEFGHVFNFELDTHAGKIHLNPAHSFNKIIYALPRQRPLSLTIIKELSEAFVVDASPLIKTGYQIIHTPPYRHLLSNHYEIDSTRTQAFARNFNIVVNYEKCTITYAFMPLPKTPKKMRMAHKNIGYLTVPVYTSTFRSYDAIMRHAIDLHPDNTVRTPIRYYIDPNIPKSFQQTVKIGIESWNAAFEEIGLAGAIEAILPTDKLFPDDFHPADLRYNTISYAIGEGRLVGTAATQIDPRSGEILCSKIVLSSTFVNLISSKVEKSMQSSASYSPRGSFSCFHMQHQYRKLHNLHQVFKDQAVDFALIRQALQDTVVHEVGHTLGLRHNFGGSLAYSIDQLNNVEFTKIHGISSSVMDYLPLNIWPQTTLDQMIPSHLFQARIGAYDKLAIEFGYKVIPGEKSGSLHPHLHEIASRVSAFYTDEDTSFDINPLAAENDLSSDPISFSLTQVQAMEASDEYDADFYRRLLQRLTHLTTFIGGTIRDSYYELFTLKAELSRLPPARQYISADDQMRAIEKLVDLMRIPPPSLKNHSVYGNFSQSVMEIVLSPNTLMRFTPSEKIPLSLSNFLLRLRRLIWRSDASVSEDFALLSAHIHALGKIATTDYADLIERSDLSMYLSIPALRPSLDMIQEARTACRKELVELLDLTSTCHLANRRQLRSGSSEFPKCLVMASLHNRIYRILQGDSVFQYHKHQVTSSSSRSSKVTLLQLWWLILIVIGYCVL